MKSQEHPTPAAVNSSGEPAAEARPKVRKPYERPAFAREQLFETMALSCGKVNPTSGQCRAFRKNS